MASAPIQIREGPGPVFVESVFFKTFPDVQLGSPVEELLERSTQCLDCSNKFGCLIIAGQPSLLILRAEDILVAQSRAADTHQKHVDLAGIPHIQVNNPSFFGSSPNLVSISNGEEFIGFDTLRNGVPFVLIFKLEQFILQSGASPPFCEIRASSKEGSRVSGIAWNPGENMNNMLAINCDDGSLQLATIKGEKAVEISSFKEGGVKSMCWSPKGKQLVVGKTNGNLSQLKLDLTEAKQIPGPGNGRVPSAIFWSSTTQFLVNFIVQDMDIDFMQLDLAKGAPPLYSNYGDIFVSDKVSSASKCIFVPVLQWNVLLCSSNTINDVLVLMKGLQQGTENWSLAEIDDNRRAAIPIDSFSVGATLFTGCETPINFSDTENFGPMPVLFVISNAGALCSVAVVNNNSSAPSLLQKVTNPLNANMFTLKTGNNGRPSIAATTPNQIPTASPIQPAQQTVQTTPNSFKQPPAQQLNQAFQPQTTVATSSIFSQPASLPSLQQVEDLKRIVEERRAQGAQQLEAADDADYDNLSIELEKFQNRMESFRNKQMGMRQQVIAKLDEICKKFEQEVLVGLNIMEDFVNAIEETTNAQKDEVSGLKEKILSHFTQLEYAKSLAERNKDPRYIELLRAQQMDPSTLNRFHDVEKLYHYVRNQVSECERFFKIQTQNAKPLEGAAAIQVIYQALSNHSKIIKRLVRNLNNMRAQVGLSQCIDLDDEMEEFQTPSLGYGYFEKKPMVRSRPNHSNPNNYRFIQSIEKKPHYSDRITMDDITAGISRVKLQREAERFPDRKPLKISAKKLEIIASAVSKTVDIQVSNEIEEWEDPMNSNFSKRINSKSKISQLDDKTLPPSMMNNLSIKEEPKDSKPKATTNTISSSGPAGFIKSPVPVVTSVPTSYQSKPTQSVSPAASIPKSQVPSQASGFSAFGASTGGSSLFGVGSLSKPSDGTDAIFKQVPTTPTGSSELSRLLSSPVQGTGSNSLFGSSSFVPETTNPNLAISKPKESQKPVVPIGSLGGVTNTNNASSPISSQPVTVSTANSAVSGVGGISFSGSTFSMPNSAGGGLFGSSSGQSGNIFGSLGSSTPAFGTSTSQPPSLFGSKSISFGPVTASVPAPVEANATTSNATTTAAGGDSILNRVENNKKSEGNQQVPISAVSAGDDKGMAATAIKDELSSSNADTAEQPGGFRNRASATVGQKDLQTNLFGKTKNTPLDATTGTNPSGTPQPNLFGPLTTSATPSSGLFGTSSTTSLFGTLPAVSSGSQKSLLGTPPSSTKTASPGLGATIQPRVLFGAAPETTPKTSDDSTTASVADKTSQPSLLASAPASTSSQPSLFGTLTASSSASQVGAFGSTTVTPASQSSIFATGTTPSTGTQSSSLLDRPRTPNPTESSIFNSTTTSTAGQASIFGAAPAVTTQSSLFAAAATPSTTTTPPSGLFSSTSLTSQPSIFGSAPSFANTQSNNLFGGPPTTTSTQGGIFGGTASATAPPSGLFGSATPATESKSSIFGGAGDGGQGSIFGTSASPFGGTQTQQPSAGVFGSPSAVSSSGGGIFSSPPNVTAPAFGAASPSVFGSSPFGGTAKPATPSTGSNVFGGSSFSGGTTTAPDSIFGGNAFGGLGAQPSSDAAGKNVFGSGAVYGSNVSQGIFGGGSASAASPSSGLFTGGTGTTAGAVSQTGFSFATTTKPTSGFGSAPVFGANTTAKPAGFGSAPVFGGTPAFGSTSPFGSAFGSSSPSSPTAFGGGSSSIFGGATAQQSAATFGALAQTAPPAQTGFGTFGGTAQAAQPSSPFGGQAQNPAFGQAQQQTSPFGGQKPASSSFGGSAFSSWR